jgi:hypothetical protein
VDQPVVHREVRLAVAAADQQEDLPEDRLVVPREVRQAAVLVILVDRLVVDRVIPAALLAAALVLRAAQTVDLVETPAAGLVIPETETPVPATTVMEMAMVAGTAPAMKATAKVPVTTMAMATGTPAAITAMEAASLGRTNNFFFFK